MNFALLLFFYQFYENLVFDCRMAGALGYARCSTEVPQDILITQASPRGEFIFADGFLGPRHPSAPSARHMYFSAGHTLGKIAEHIASLMAFEAPAAAAMLKAGISKSAVLRIVACAWEWLEKCPRVLADNHLMALGVLRLSVKFELPDSQQPLALQLLDDMDGEKRFLLSMEKRFLNLLWSVREPGVEQPLTHLR